MKFTRALVTEPRRGPTILRARATAMRQRNCSFDIVGLSLQYGGYWVQHDGVLMLYHPSGAEERLLVRMAETRSLLNARVTLRYFGNPRPRVQPPFDVDICTVEPR